MTAKKAAPKAPKPIEWGPDGSITFHFPKATPQLVRWEPPLVGGMTQLFDIERRVVDDPDERAWSATARWIVAVSDEVYGIKLDLAKLPHWALSMDVRRAIINHFLTVPFELPTFELPGLTVVAAPRPATDGQPELD